MPGAEILPFKAKKAKKPKKPGKPKGSTPTPGGYHSAKTKAEKKPEISIVAEAEKTLWNRIRKVDSIRLLDGSPCDLDRLMTEANRKRKLWGMEPLGRKPEWLQ